MKSIDALLLGINNLYKYLKNELYKNSKMFKIILIPYLLLLFFIGYQLFFTNNIINYLGYTLSAIFLLFYILSIYALTKMILTEYGVIKKSKLDNKFLNSTKQLLESSEKKYFKPNETTKLQDEVIILNKKTSNNNESIKSVKDNLIKGNKNHTDFIKNEFEPIKNIANKNTSEIETLNKKTSNNSESIKSVKDGLIKVNKNHIDFVKNEFEPTKNLLSKTTKRTTIIEDQIFIKEKIKTYCSLKDIKSIFMEYKKDLFENLDVHNFMKYMFEGSNKLGASNLFDEEKNNILAIMTLLIEKEKIDGNNSVLFRLAKPYLKLDIELRMFGIKVKKRKYSLTNDITESHILKKITNFKNI